MPTGTDKEWLRRIEDGNSAIRDDLAKVRENMAKMDTRISALSENLQKQGQIEKSVDNLKDTTCNIDADLSVINLKIGYDKEGTPTGNGLLGKLNGLNNEIAWLKKRIITTIIVNSIIVAIVSLFFGGELGEFIRGIRNML